MSRATVKSDLANTGAVTLQIGTLPTNSIKYNGFELVSGDFRANELIIVAFEAAVGEFVLVNKPSNQFLIQSLHGLNQIHVELTYKVMVLFTKEQRLMMLERLLQYLIQ